MSEGASWLDRVRSRGSSEEVKLGLETLFPSKDAFERLQMLGETSNKAVMPWTVLGVFRGEYKSKILKAFQREYNFNKVALDRKGRLEASGVLSSFQKSSEEGRD